MPSFNFYDKRILNLHLMKRAFFILFSIFSLQVCAQVSEVDTSYTLSSAYQKIISKYPSITKVLPGNYASLTEIDDLVYLPGLRDSLKLDAIYTKNKTRPAVVLIHGGGWRSGNKSMMKPLAQHLALKGYQCFSVEYSLSGQKIFPAALKDIKAAVKFIRSNSDGFFVDSSKIAILGCSAGGQLAALAGTTNGETRWEEKKDNISAEVQAIVNIDGIVSFDHPESKEGEAAAIWLGGSKEVQPDIWKEASPLFHTGQHTPPTLFINGKDARFHAGRDDMIRILDEYHIPHQTYLIPDAPHTFWLFNPWFEETSDHIVTFLDKIFN